MSAIDNDVVALFHRVRQSRNAAVHAGREVFSPGEAVEYHLLCRTLADGLRKGVEAVEARAKERPNPTS